MARLLLNITKKPNTQSLKYHLLAAEIAIRYGGWKYPNITPYTDEHIQECWTDPNEPMPTSYWLRRHIRVLAVREYIREYFDLSDPIWNSDFIHGLFKHGKISWADSKNKHRFPTFSWDYQQYLLTRLIQVFPYGGEKSIWEGKLKGVPALCVKHRENTISFVSGVLSAGSNVEIEKTDFASYNGNTIPYIRKWGIPIEMTIPETGDILISPFWPALFTPYMPEITVKNWMNSYNPCKAEIYSAILWRLYCDCEFPTRAIPYLQSCKTVFTKFKTDKLSAMDNLERMRVTHGLTGLDNRIGDMVKEWRDKHEKEQEKRIAL